jgi:ornithine cyclodeaminase
VLIVGRTAQRAEEFVQSVSLETPTPTLPQRGREISIEAAASVEDALRDADVVVTCTSSRDPVISRAMLRKGMHINVVGGSQPPAHELEPAALADVVLFTDRRQSLEGEAHEWRTAVAEGIIKPDHLRGELGQLLNGSVTGRRTADEITVFRSLGLAVEDVAAAQHVLGKLS